MPREPADRPCPTCAGSGKAAGRWLLSSPSPVPIEDLPVPACPSCGGSGRAGAKAVRVEEIDLRAPRSPDALSGRR